MDVYPRLPALSDGFITIHDGPPRLLHAIGYHVPDFWLLESVHFFSRFHTTRTPAAAFLVSLTPVSLIHSAGPSSQRALAEQMPVISSSLPNAFRPDSRPPGLWGRASEDQCLPFEFPALHPVYLCWSVCFEYLSCSGLPVICPHLGETSLSQKGCFLSFPSLWVFSHRP